MKIKVTQEHIDRANELREKSLIDYEASCHCPVALAVKEHFDLPDHADAVGHSLVFYTVDDEVVLDYFLNEEAERFIQCYDANLAVKPFWLEPDFPRGILLMKIKVTQEHIDRAIHFKRTRRRTPSMYCPMALAIQETFGLDEGTSCAGGDGGSFEIDGKVRFYLASNPASNFTITFDNNEEVKPIEFELTFVDYEV